MVHELIVIVSLIVFCRYIMFFQVPYFPEWFSKRYDLGMFDLMYNRAPSGREGMVSPEDMEAYKYHFSQPGTYIFSCIILTALT